MVNCCDCKRWFRDNYSLKRHMSRSKPCVVKNEHEQKRMIAENSTPIAENSTLDAENSTLGAENNTLGAENSTSCVWCLKSFSTKFNLMVHMKSCHLRDDPVRILERELGITPTLNNNKCRFCDRSFSRKFTADRHRSVCQKREEYILSLKNQKNNTKINPFGNESLEHIELSRLLSIFQSINETYRPDDYYIKAGKLITAFAEYINLDPLNNNIKLKSDRSKIGKVYYPDGWESMDTDDIVDRSFKNTANKLNNQGLNNTPLNVHNRNVLGIVSDFAQVGIHQVGANHSERKRVFNGFKVALVKINRFK